MNDLNTITVVGRLGRDAELKYIGDGTACLGFSIAVNRSEKKDGQWVDVADWWKVEMFGKRAEAVAKYLTKGKQVAVSGQAAINKGKDDKLYPTIKANEVQLLGGKESRDEAPPERGHQDAPRRDVGAGKADDFTDDIPF